MKVITQRTLIRDVYKAWRKQYGRNHGMGSDKDTITKQLKALDVERATAADVEAIIGNDSWTKVPECDECHEHRDIVVRVGQEPDYESSTANLCVDCLKAAIKAAKEAK